MRHRSTLCAYLVEMAGIAFTMSIGSAFEFGGNALPRITPSLLEKTADWTDEEITALILHRLFTKELEVNILEERGLEGIVSLDWLFEQRRVSTTMSNQALQTSFNSKGWEENLTRKYLRS